MDFFSLILGKSMSGGSGGSSGVEYTNIVYNKDNTVTLTEKDGTVHTMACTYENGKLTGVTYDGENIYLTYAEDLLLNVSGTSVDVNNAPSASGSDSKRPQGIIYVKSECRKSIVQSVTEAIKTTVTAVKN